MSATRSSNRLPWLLGALALAAVLVVTDERAPSGVVEATRTPALPAGPTGAGMRPAALPATGTAAAAPVEGAGAQSVAALLDVRPREAARTAPDLFERRSWAPPPPPPVAQKPVPPAFGFTVLGKQFIDGRWEVFLGQGARTLIVKQGDRIDGQFMVERIAPPSMTLAVANFDARQTVPIGPAD
jgi:hypothetical protein